MRLGIDASNIRGGGGLTHLCEMLRFAHPEQHGFSSVIVWGGHRTLSILPEHVWLKKVHIQELDGGLFQRVVWQVSQLSKVAAESCDVLFIPGSNYIGNFKPFVALSQNMLPFDPVERNRFFPSITFIRLLLLRALQARTFLHADACIFLTQYAHLAIQRQIGRPLKITSIIPHGIDTRFFWQPKPQQSLSSFSLSKPFKLLYVSIITPYKHQMVVVEAVAQLRKRGLPVQLDLIGPAYAPSLKQLQATMQHHDVSGEYIRYHGSIPFDQLDQWYHQTDAFIFASSCENLPNILLEAMASGLPVACSNRNPMPEILQDAGVYFNPENSLELVQAIEELITSHEKRANLALKAFNLAQAYSWEKCAESTFAFLAEIANPK